MHKLKRSFHRFVLSRIKGTAHTVSDKYAYYKEAVPDADTLMNPTKGLKDEETGILNEILKASDQEEVIHENLKEEKTTLLVYTHTKLSCIQSVGKKNMERTKCSFS